MQMYRIKSLYGNKVGLPEMTKLNLGDATLALSSVAEQIQDAFKPHRGLTVGEMFSEQLKGRGSSCPTAE
jgi:hypothetical protein